MVGGVMWTEDALLAKVMDRPQCLIPSWCYADDQHLTKPVQNKRCISTNEAPNTPDRSFCTGSKHIWRQSRETALTCGICHVRSVIPRERERERAARENLAVNVFQKDTKLNEWTRVQVDGLQSAAHLNARTNQVIGLDAHKERRATHVQKLT